MSELDNLIKIYRERVHQALKRSLPPKDNSRLLDAVHYSVLNGGKRLRSILVYLGSELGKTEPSIADSIACAVEFIHCYSLIHDDLPAMDDDKLRRGKATCHIEFDEATDGISASPETISSSPVPQRVELTLEDVESTHEPKPALQTIVTESSKPDSDTPSAGPLLNSMLNSSVSAKTDALVSRLKTSQSELETRFQSQEQEPET